MYTVYDYYYVLNHNGDKEPQWVNGERYSFCEGFKFLSSLLRK